MVLEESQKAVRMQAAVVDLCHRADTLDVVGRSVPNGTDLLPANAVRP